MNKILRVFLLALLAIIVGNVSAEEVTMKYTGDTTTNMTGDNDAATVGLDATVWSVVGAKGAANNLPGLNKAGDIRLYYNVGGSNTITVSSNKYVINSIALTFTGDSYSNVTVTVNGAAVSATDGKYAINNNSFVLGNGNTGNTQVRIKEVVINYTASSDTRTATSIDLGTYQTKFTCGKDGENYTLPTVTVKAGDATVDGASVTWTMDVKLWFQETQPTIDNGKIAIPNNAYGIINLTASYAGNDTYKESSETYTLTVYKGSTNISEFWEAFENKKEALAGQGIPVSYWPVNQSGDNITIREELITYANGARTYLIDNDNKYSILLYKSNLGLKTGDKITISGAATENGIYGILKTYNGLLELEVTDFGGVVASSGNEVTPKTIDEAFLKNVSSKASEFLNSYIKIEGAKFVSANNKDLTFTVGETTLAVYNQFDVDASTLEAGATYTLTGMGSIYKTNYQLYLVGFTKTAEPSGIDAVKADANADAPAYNLAGQKVADGFKGLVIKNGKKFMK